MDFSGLIKGVQDFWDFIWPPILCLIALFGITFYLAPHTFKRCLTKLSGWKPTEASQIQFIKVSKRFGFDKLLPIICAFFLIFFLDAIRNVVVVGGQTIPPVISYTPSGILLDEANRSTVRCMWASKAETLYLRRQAVMKSDPPQTVADPGDVVQPKDDERFYLDPRFGDVRFEDVSNDIEQAVTEAKTLHKDAPPVTSLHYEEENIGTAHMTFSGLKFLFLYALILSFFEIRRSPVKRQVVFKTIVILAVITAGMLVFFLRYIKAVESVEAAKIHIAETYPIKGGMDCEVPDADRQAIDKLYDRTVKYEKHWSKKWWSLRFPSMQPVTWSWKQLSEDHPGPS